MSTSQGPSPTVSETGFLERAEVVIIGAGIVGCSIAYHLAQKGVRDIVIVEKDRWPGPGGWRWLALTSAWRN